MKSVFGLSDLHDRITEGMFLSFSEAQGRVSRRERKSPSPGESTAALKERLGRIEAILRSRNSTDGCTSINESSGPSNVFLPIQNTVNPEESGTWNDFIVQATAEDELDIANDNVGNMNSVENVSSVSHGTAPKATAASRSLGPLLLLKPVKTSLRIANLARWHAA